MDELTRIEVGGDRPYQVVVGRDLLGELPGLLVGAGQVAVLFARPLVEVASRVSARLRAAGFAVLEVEIPDAEAGKRLAVAQRCWDGLGAAGFTRTDAIVGVGGGAVTDLAGFVAACWLRGVGWVAVATSVLGMVDAAVGGKTGINTDAGKNLVGAFYPPRGVLCDLSILESLAPAEVATGLAEVVKCGFIADPRILDLVESDPAAALDPSTDVLRELVERAVRVKAHVVTRDLRESGLREILNYGHTLAHAIEKVEDYTWRHGHAVSVGLVYAAALAHEVGRLAEPIAARHSTILRSLGLPVTYQPQAWPAVLAAMRVDKKARGARLRFVVLDDLGAPSIMDDVTDDTLAHVYRKVCS